MRWLHSLGLVPEAALAGGFGEALAVLASGTLLCDLVAAIEGTPVKGVFKKPVAEAARSSNVRRACARLARHGDMSRRYLYFEAEMVRGDRAVLLGLLEDIHRFYDGLAPLPAELPADAKTPYPAPYLPGVEYGTPFANRPPLPPPLPDHSPKRTPEPSPGPPPEPTPVPRSPLSAVPAWQHGLGAVSTEDAAAGPDDALSVDDAEPSCAAVDVPTTPHGPELEARAEAASAWLQGLGLAGWGVSQGGEPDSAVDALVAAFRTGLLLCELAQAVDARVELRGLRVPPGTAAARLVNVRAGVDAISGAAVPPLPPRARLSARKVAAGDPLALLALLEAVHGNQAFRRRLKARAALLHQAAPSPRRREQAPSQSRRTGAEP